MKKYLIPFLAISLFSVFLLRALLAPGFFTSHDGEHHVTRMAAYFLALSDGQMPPRWTNNFNGGLGSTIFVFIYPLPYILGSILHIFGISFTDSFKVLIGTGFLFSGWFFYLWLKPKFGEYAALLSALVFLAAPYRFLMIFVRGAYPESFAYTFVPLAFYCLDKLYISSKPRRWVALGAVVFSAMLLSQNLVAFMFAPVIGAYGFGRAWQELKNTGWNQPNTYKIIVRVLMVFVLGFFIAGFIYLPDISELKYTHFSQLISYYRDHFVYFWQLIRSPWGYGFSFAGDGDGMSFQLGLVQIGFILLLPAWLLIKITFHRAAIKNWVGQEKNIDLLLLGIGTIVGSLLLIIESPLAHLLWERLPRLTTIDYPWRLLGMSIFGTAVLAGFFISKLRPNWQVPIVIVALVLLLVANRNFLRINERVDFSDRYLETYTGRDTHLGEFTPLERKTTEISEFKTSGEFIEGSGQAFLLTKSTNQLAFQLAVSSMSARNKFRINQLYFPGWQYYLDGRELVRDQGYRVDGGFDLKRNIDLSGLPDIIIPVGDHKVTAKFVETPIRKIADWVSLLSLTIAGGLMIL